MPKLEPLRPGLRLARSEQADSEIIGLDAAALEKWYDPILGAHGLVVSHLHVAEC